MTVKDLETFYKYKNEHYPISDKFVQCENGKYRQSEKNGYVRKAKRLGKSIDTDKAEPSQKWHLLISYCKETPADKKVYISRFLCPELILWMAEAAGIEESILVNASITAKRMIDTGHGRNAAGRKIMEMVGSKNLEEIIMSAKTSI